MHTDATRIRQRPDATSFLVAEREWEDLRDVFLSGASANSIWRFSPAPKQPLPRQGWKLHVSATILSATETLRRVGPMLTCRGVLFKGPASLVELKKLNCGLFYGFSQVGKFLTVYPSSRQEACDLAASLHELTGGLTGPAVPFDLPYRPGGTIYYRYGAFSAGPEEAPDEAAMIRTAGGELVPDRREYGFAVPTWEDDPFAGGSPPGEGLVSLAPYAAYEALSQRGKGGVYGALDLSRNPARRCILKEGRSRGEIDWDGRDGAWRVRHEGYVLENLGHAGIAVPGVYCQLERCENAYLVTERISGKNLQLALLERRRRLSLRKALALGWRIARLVDAIHSAGWAWRDCKPHNLVLGGDGSLRPIDFEGACELDGDESMPWGTPGYLAPEWLSASAAGSHRCQDLYALGVTLQQLFTGRLPTEGAPSPIDKLRPQVPTAVREIISALLSGDPEARPRAALVATELESIERASRHRASRPAARAGRQYLSAPSECRLTTGGRAS